jgi:hypothetical protein
MHTNPACAPKEETIIRISPRSGVWNVSVDARFYGDYLRRDWAVEAAAAKKQALAKEGVWARIDACLPEPRRTLFARLGRLLRPPGSRPASGDLR